jgi:hypothetical protein
MGAKPLANAKMMAKKLINHGMLASKHPGVPSSPDTIVGRG